jgi:hypothetical protein
VEDRPSPLAGACRSQQDRSATPARPCSPTGPRNPWIVLASFKGGAPAGPRPRWPAICTRRCA